MAVVLGVNSVFHDPAAALVVDAEAPLRVPIEHARDARRASEDLAHRRDVGR